LENPFVFGFIPRSLTAITEEKKI